MRRRHRGETVKEDLSQGLPGRGGCLPVSFGMFGMLWGRHAASRISSRSSGHTTMVLKRLTWGTVGDTLSAVCAAHPNRVILAELF